MHTPAPRPNPSNRFSHAFRGSVIAAIILTGVFLLQQAGSWWLPFAAKPGVLENLTTGWGYALFHAGFPHLLSNIMALVILGTLAYGLYPRTTLRAIPLALVFSFMAIWLLGNEGTLHVGTSGITYGLMALVATLGIFRKERPARGAGLVVCFFFGGAWWSMLPIAAGISWEGHLGGSIAGVLAAIAWRGLDPPIEPPSPLEDEDEEDAGGWGTNGNLSSSTLPVPPFPPPTGKLPPSLP